MLNNNKHIKFCRTRIFRAHFIFAKNQFWTFRASYFRVLGYYSLSTFVIILLRASYFRDFLYNREIRENKMHTKISCLAVNKNKWTRDENEYIVSNNICSICIIRFIQGCVLVIFKTKSCLGSFSVQYVENERLYN